MKETVLVTKGEQVSGRIAELYLTVLLCVFPLYINHELYIRLTYHKTLFLYVSTAVVALCLSAVFVISKRKLKELLPLTVIDYAVLIFLYWNIFSAAFSPYKGHLFMGVPERHDGLISQMVYVFIYFAISRFYKLKARNFCWFAISAIIVSLIGILQFYDIAFTSWLPFDMYYENALDQTPFARMNSYTMIFRTTLGHHNIVSTYICVAAVFCYVLYILYEPYKFLYLASAAISTLMLFISDTSSGVLAIVAAFLFMLILFMGRKETFSRLCISGAVAFIAYIIYAVTYLMPIARHMSVVTLIVLICLALFFMGAGVLLGVLREFKPVIISNITKKQLVMRVAVFLVILIVGIGGIELLGKNEGAGTIYEVREIMHGRIDVGFGSLRILIWRQALGVWHKRPLIGTGPDTFYFALGEEFQKAAVEKYWNAFDKAHNEYLQILICLGIPGLLAYLVLIIGTELCALKSFFKKNLRCPYKIAAVCAIFTYAIQAFFNINIPITAPLLWIFLGILNQKGSPQLCERNLV